MSDPRLGIGGNNPPEPTIEERLQETYGDLEDEVLEVAVRANGTPKEIENDDQLAAVGLIVRDANQLAAKADAARIKEKAPHLQAGRDVDAFFYRWAKDDRDPGKMGRVSKIAKVLTARIARYQDRKVAALRAAQKADDERRALREKSARDEEARAAKAGLADEAAKHKEMADGYAGLREDAALAQSGPIAGAVRVKTGDVTVSASEHWGFTIHDARKIDLNALREHFTADQIEAAVSKYVRTGGRTLDGVTIEKTTRAIVR